MIEEVCRKLKEKRAELGYSIEYTVEKTKLYPSVIKDIEAGQLAKISPAYVKGFIKIYAAFLGVDLGTALEEIAASAPSRSIPRKIKIQDTAANASILKTYAKFSPQVRQKIFIILGGAVLLWGFFSVSKFAVRKISGVFKSKPAEESVPVKPQDTSLSLDEAEGITVVVTARKDCFLRVTSDGRLLFEGVLNQGVVETWTGNKEVEFNIKDGSAVALAVNGKSIPTLTTIPKPIKSLKITPTGISVDK